MTTVNTDAIERFMKGQVACWNAHDKAGFLAHYKAVAPDRLVIDYAGRPDIDADGWLVIEDMYDQHNAHCRLEVVETIYNGNDVAAHHRNIIESAGVVIESIETYRFSPGTLHVCYFLKPPSGPVDLTQFRGFA